MSLSVKMNGNKMRNISELTEILKDEINGDLISESWRGDEVQIVALLSFEKFYYRTSSSTSLTIMLTQINNSQTADVIGFGGGIGLLNYSYGTNAEFAEVAIEILSRHGFVEEGL